MGSEWYLGKNWKIWQPFLWFNKVVENEGYLAQNSKIISGYKK